MNYTDLYRVKPDEKVNLSKMDPGDTDERKDKEAAEEDLARYVAELRQLQYLLYAENKRSLLICLQAMDAAGKDGVIRHVFSSVNPQGCRVAPFKAPSKDELEHDFLWRIHAQTPAKGEIAIFNRSHYEDVLVARVHELVPKEVWSKRFGIINDFEKMLTDQGTVILKFFLHISKDEQLQRFKDRLDDPAKQWKISDYDYSERKRWDEYQRAYEDALEKTSTKHAPWFVIPANHKWFRNLAVSNIIVHTLRDMEMKTPEPTVDLAEIRRLYHEAARE